jgi:hypothetical protein
MRVTYDSSKNTDNSMALVRSNWNLSVDFNIIKQITKTLIPLTFNNDALDILTQSCSQPSQWATCCLHATTGIPIDGYRHDCLKVGAIILKRGLHVQKCKVGRLITTSLVLWRLNWHLDGCYGNCHYILPQYTIIPCLWEFFKLQNTLEKALSEEQGWLRDTIDLPQDH